METFTPWSSLAGGALIGLAASLYLLGDGRIAGVSGIVESAASPQTWRDGLRGRRSADLFFLLGLALAGLATAWFRPSAIRSSPLPLTWLVLAGLLVGFGTRLSGGCTSGHGVCGISRSSLRSMVATVIFMLTGALTVFAVRHLGGTP